MSVWAGTTGELDEVPVEDIRRFESEFLDYLQSSHKGIFDGIRETNELCDDTVTVLKDAITEFKKGFTTSSGELLVKDEPVAPLEERRGRPGEDPQGRPLGGEEVADGCPAKAAAAADQVGQVDRQDHARPGAHRLFADREGADADAGGVAVRA